MTPSDLPIEDVLPDILRTAAENTRLVIAAPPGAGKTTRVPLALLGQPWMTGRIILLEPRRIAARAAAERMARTLGERVGETVGLRSRLDVRIGPKTRIEVVTEGVFSRLILSDPGLDGVSAVIFDEFHERSLDADLGLALALDTQGALREDLRILIMSATLNVAAVQGFLDAPTVASEGRAHPVVTRHLGSEPNRRIEDQMASAIRTALSEETGSILAFLPGAAEIRRTAERLEGLAATTSIAPLYGALSPQDQSRAIEPAAPGHRKIVLATDIAESALTIEGVRVVVDSGLARVPRFDISLGASRLETIRVAIANADQRRGRAGRLGPGVCYRLWREAEERGFQAHPDPEILDTDLTGLVLDLASWGARSPAELRWLDPPPETAWRLAREALIRHGAVNADGELTDLGRRVAKMPVAPRIGLMVLHAADEGAGQLAADIAALMSERDLGGRSVDAEVRLSRFRSEDNQRARAMRDLAKRWAKLAGGRDTGEADAGGVIAAAFPERIARARAGRPGRFVMAGGRGCMLDETDPLARESWLAVADVTGAGADLRITLAARLSEDDAHRLGGATTEDDVRFDAATTGVRARRITRIGSIVLSEQPLPSPPADTVQAGLLAAVREQGLALIPNREPLDTLIARVQFLGAAMGDPWPRDFRSTLVQRLDDWLPGAMTGATRLTSIDPGRLADAALTLLEWPLPRELDKLAPRRWETPAGRVAEIDYAAEGGPRASVKVGEVFGPAPHPALAGGRIPLTLELLSPAQRPVALTRDIQAFWKGGYIDLRKNLRGRYPKHPWPEDPASAEATSRAKPRGA
jgi:ATP-dependent helicase HrpB